MGSPAVKPFAQKGVAINAFACTRNIQRGIRSKRNTVTAGHIGAARHAQVLAGSLAAAASSAARLRCTVQLRSFSERHQALAGELTSTHCHAHIDTVCMPCWEPPLFIRRPEGYLRMSFT